MNMNAKIAGRGRGMVTFETMVRGRTLAIGLHRETIESYADRSPMSGEEQAEFVAQHRQLLIESAVACVGDDDAVGIVLPVDCIIGYRKRSA